MTETLPARWYHDAEHHHREWQAIFGTAWQLAGHISAIPQPSGVWATTVGGRPVLVVRDEIGDIRAYHNVCRHRASPLMWDGQTESCAHIRCRYHGWRYDLDGTLRAAPGYGAPPPDGLHLFGIHVTLWNGLVFVSFAKQPPPIDDILSPLQAAAGTLPWAEMTVVRTVRHTLRCNWKTYTENYLEGYHIPWLHPGLTEEVAMRDYHVDVQGRTALHQVPTRSGALSQGVWIWLWPTTAINVYGAGINLETIHPRGPEETEIRYQYLFPAGHPASAQEAAMAMSQQVTEEDIQICEAVQQNLRTGIYTTGQLSPRHEGGVAAFQAWVRESLR